MIEIGQETTFQDFWDNIKTDSVALKVNYFIRNEWCIRSTVKVDAPLIVNGEITEEMGQRWSTIDELVDFLATKCCIVRYTAAYVARESLNSTEQFEIQFRTYFTDKKFERLVRTHKVVRSSPNKDWVNLPD